jgi:hypothetical protein
LAPPPPQRAAASRLLRAGPPASAATGTQCLRFPPLAGSLSPPGSHDPGSLFRRSPSHVPCKSRRPGSRRLYAGHHLASNTGSRQAHPEGLPRTPGFDAISRFSTPQQRTPTPDLPGPSASGTSSWSPPDPITPGLFPGRSPRQSPANAAPGRFDANPRRADAGGPTSLHLSHSTAYVRGFLHDPSFSVRDALIAALQELARERQTSAVAAQSLGGLLVVFAVG